MLSPLPLGWMQRWMPWSSGAPADERFKAELVLGISALLLLVCVFFTVHLSASPNGTIALIACCAVGATVHAINLVLLRWRRSSRFAPWILSLALMTLISAASLLTVGYRSDLSGWQVCIALLTMFLIGVRAGAICTLLMGVQVLAMWWLEAEGIYVPPTALLEAPAAEALASAWVMLLAVVGLGVIYERTHAARRQVLSSTIEELRAAHRDLASAQNGLIAAEKLSSLGLLAAGVAHEINNPMAYVTSNISALSRELGQLRSDPALMKEYAEEVLPATLDGIQRVNAIVSDLRRFASGDPEAFIEYDVNAEIAAALRMAHSELSKRRARTDLALGDLPKVLGLPRQIMQVVMNLVVNAAHASKEGGVVRVASWVASDEVAIKVQDAGVGMCAKTVSKLFQPFFTTKPVGEGTGLGLAIAHGIIAAHGGRIEVASSPGSGSAFTLYLPIIPPVRLAVAGAS